MTAKESDNVKNSFMAIKATQKQSCEEEDVAKAFQLGLALGLCEKHNEMDKTLQQQPCGDCISRQAVLDKMKERDEELSSICPKDIKDLPPVIPQPKMGSSSENPNKWIPITSRPMTEEEKEHYKTHPEYQDDCGIFNCKLPDDGQEVLISVYGGVEVDTFVQDANDGCYFEGRDIDDVDAWMPLPEPYKQEVEE